MSVLLGGFSETASEPRRSGESATPPSRVGSRGGRGSRTPADGDPPSSQWGNCCFRQRIVHQPPPQPRTWPIVSLSRTPSGMVTVIARSLGREELLARAPGPPGRFCGVVARESRGAAKTPTALRDVDALDGEERLRVDARPVCARVVHPRAEHRHHCSAIRPRPLRHECGVATPHGIAVRPAVTICGLRKSESIGLPPVPVQGLSPQSQGGKYAPHPHSADNGSQHGSASMRSRSGGYRHNGL